MNISPTTKLSDLTVAEFCELISSVAPKEIIQNSTFLDAKGVAAFLGYKISNVYALTHKRLIPFMKKGTRLWFDREDILTWVKSGKKKTVEEMQKTLSIKTAKSKIHE